MKTFKIFYMFREKETSVSMMSLSSDEALAACHRLYPQITPLRVEEITETFVKRTGFLSRTRPAAISSSDEAYLLSVAEQVRIRVYWMEEHDVHVHTRFRDWGISDQLPEDIRPNEGEGQWSMSTCVQYPVLNDGTFPSSDILNLSGETQNNEFVLGLLQLGEPGNRPFRITDYTREKTTDAVVDTQSEQILR